MTLLATEIHYHGKPYGGIIFAADRRISLGRKRHSDQRKIFPIPRLFAGIGYFGLAEVPTAHATEQMAVWLERFLATSTAATLEELARELTATLNKAIPVEWRYVDISGFHLCGYAAVCRPEFWFIRNCDDWQNLTGVYEAREDFQGRDAPGIPPEGSYLYRNGDIRAHVSAWASMDKVFEGLLSAPEFGGLSTTAEYARWVQFKMEVIARFYESFCKESIIGLPVDYFCITRPT
jgi:hypothetical protein